MTVDKQKPFVVDTAEQRAMRALLEEVQRRGYDLSPTAFALLNRLQARNVR